MTYLDQSGLLSRLSAYPLLAYCLTKYIQWITSNIQDGLENYDVIRLLNEGNLERLCRIEARLEESRDILGLSENEFARTFGFNDDLLTEDPEKIHDILAEPLLVIDLSRQGFSSIKKLPPFIRTSSKKKRNADFLASLGKTKFAIELKTIRMESRPKPERGRLLGDATKSDWWGDMFRRNAITKIEDKNRRIFDQLENTRQQYRCDSTMIILYTRRLGPSTLMTTQDYIEELKNLLLRYPEIDAIGCKDYFGQVTIVPRV